MYKKLLAVAIAAALCGCQSQSKENKYNLMTANEIYQHGVKQTRKKHYITAIEDFEALEARYPFGDYADNAQLGAIYAMYMNEDYPSALPAVERFIRMYPRHENIDYAYYMQGLIHFSESLGFFSKYLPQDRAERDASSAKKGLNAFNNLVQRYPNSKFTPDAKLRMVYLRNMIAENELVASRFYLKKGAWNAAANRANYVVAHFDETPSMAEALSIMVESYRQLELTKLANDTYRILSLNFPDSEFLKALG
jgi:outer membrane protein assembly factor BamD